MVGDFLTFVFSSCSYVFLMICPYVSLGFSTMFLRFPMNSPRLFPISLHWFGANFPLFIYRWAKRKFHLHIKTYILRKLSSFNFCFSGHGPIKMAHNKKKEKGNYN
jgi:hypothetical protein